MSKSERRIWNNKIRRQRERRKHIIITLFTFCLVIVLSVTASSFLSNARTEDNSVSFKCYKSVVIQQGDTLWSIASENMSSENSNRDAYIREIIQMNGLRDEHITAGMYLVIPYYSPAP